MLNTYKTIHYSAPPPHKFVILLLLFLKYLFIWLCLVLVVPHGIFHL